MGLSNTQIDRLGDRLRAGSINDSDLICLDEYRLSFDPAYETVVQTIHSRLHIEPTGRPAKSTSSLLGKLKRESIRLTQVQDIAGCRIVVTDMLEQERIVEALESIFPQVSVVDRRAKSSFGYRAIHAIVKVSNKLVEVQVRTSMQHVWAELSEKWSDVIDPAIKYGGGPPEIRSTLQIISDDIANIEDLEYNVFRVRGAIQDNDELQKQMDDVDLRVLSLKRGVVKQCRDLMGWLDR